MNQTVAKIGTFVVAVLILATVGWEIAKRRGVEALSANAAAVSTVNRDISLDNFGVDDETGDPDAAADSDDVPGGDLQLQIGVIGTTPMRREVTRLASLPFTDSQMRREYRAAVDRQCRVVIPGAATIPPTNSGPRSSGNYGRIPALTIGLRLDLLSASDLPAPVRSQVRSYLEDHRLSIQPTLYRDAGGGLYFGTDTQSAFYEVDRPKVTVKSESMIDEAIGRFRSLGIVGETDDPGFGRTLAMAFTFEQADPASGGRRPVTELLLLHLRVDQADSTSVKRPEIEVYVTSDSRQTLHRVQAEGRDLSSPLATIQSDIRFDGAVLMGLYPSDPVVSAIKFRSQNVVSMEVVRGLVRGDERQNTDPLSVSEILDQFGQLSSG